MDYDQVMAKNNDTLLTRSVFNIWHIGTIQFLHILYIKLREYCHYLYIAYD